MNLLCYSVIRLNDGPGPMPACNLKKRCLEDTQSWQSIVGIPFGKWLHYRIA
jgi:hypothetical protein